MCLSSRQVYDTIEIQLIVIPREFPFSLSGLSDDMPDTAAAGRFSPRRTGTLHTRAYAENPSKLDPAKPLKINKSADRI